VDETLSKVVSDSSTINLVDTGNIGVAGIKWDRSGTMWKSGFRLYQANRRTCHGRKNRCCGYYPHKQRIIENGGNRLYRAYGNFSGLTGTKDPLTMFEVGNLRIFFLSRHVSLRQACDLVTKERVLDYIERCTRALKLLGISEGTMAVAGLIPTAERMDFLAVRRLTLWCLP